jgi:hypothetical protein
LINPQAAKGVDRHYLPQPEQKVRAGDSIRERMTWY